MTHILKADKKPNLFSFDLETENRNIDSWVFDNKRYSKRDLDKEASLLKQIAKDFISIIETKSITADQILNLNDAIINGASGVWEPATTKLELLAYHFPEAKTLITKQTANTDSKIAEKFLNAVSSAFTTQELIDLFSKTFKHRSKKVRAKSADKVLAIGDKNLIPFLNSAFDIETDQNVKDEIKFVIDDLKGSA